MKRSAGFLGGPADASGAWRSASPLTRLNQVLVS